jgi:hypothetical protein
VVRESVSGMRIMNLLSHYRPSVSTSTEECCLRRYGDGEGIYKAALIPSEKRGCEIGIGQFLHGQIISPES